MVKIIFIPFSIAAGLIAGLVGKKAFDFVWARIDEAEPPASEHRDASWPKLVAANAIQGAVFRSVRAVSDRGARIAFLRVTGRWPGEEEPDEARF